MSAALESLRKNQSLRTVTDKRVSPAWILVPIGRAVAVVVLVGIVLAETFAVIGNAINNPGSTPNFTGLYAGLSGFFGVLFLLDVLFAYFFYTLIRRRNQHFARQRHFVSDLVGVVREASAKKGLNQEAFLLSMENSNRQATTEEGEKSAVLWAILYLVPVLNIVAYLYILYFLPNDYYKHEQREDGMLIDVQRALSSLGAQFAFHRGEPIPHRSFVVYFIATLLTFGLFGLYWVYTLIIDPNHHFTDHAVYEETLDQLLAPLVA